MKVSKLLGGGSSVPINGLLPFNVGGVNKYVDPDGAVFIKTGVVDTSGDYPDAYGIPTDINFSKQLSEFGTPLNLTTDGTNITLLVSGKMYTLNTDINQGVIFTSLSVVGTDVHFDGSNYYVLDNNNNRVDKYNTEGTKISEYLLFLSKTFTSLIFDNISNYWYFFAGSTAYKYNVDFTNTGETISVTGGAVESVFTDNVNFYLLQGTKVNKFDSTWTFQNTVFDTSSVTGSSPTGVTYVGSNWFVTDGYYIYKFDSAGIFISRSPTTGIDSTPSTVMQDGNNVYVLGSQRKAVQTYNSETLNYRMLEYDLTSTGITTFKGLCSNTVNYFVCDQVNSVVHELDFNFTPTGVTFDLTPVGVGTVKGLQFDGIHFYALSTSNKRIYQLNSDFTSTGFFFSVSLEVSIPNDLIIEGDSLWVLDTSNDTYYKYEKSGEYTGESFASVSENQPQAGAFGQNTFYIVGTQNNRIRKYVKAVGYSVASVDSDTNLPIYIRVK